MVLAIVGVFDGREFVGFKLGVGFKFEFIGVVVIFFLVVGVFFRGRSVVVAPRIQT